MEPGLKPGQMGYVGTSAPATADNQPKARVLWVMEFSPGPPGQAGREAGRPVTHKGTQLSLKEERSYKTQWICKVEQGATAPYSNPGLNLNKRPETGNRSRGETGSGNTKDSEPFDLTGRLLPDKP